MESSQREEITSQQEKQLASHIIDIPPSRAETELLRTFLENAGVAYKAIIEIDFDISLIEHEYVKSIIFTCIRSYEENGEAPTVAILLEAFRDDDAVRKLIIDTSIAVEKISEEWENAELSTIQIEEKLAQSAHQSGVLIMSEVLEKRLNKLQQDIRSVKDEIEISKIMEDILATAQQIKDLKTLRMRQAI